MIMEFLQIVVITTSTLMTTAASQTPTTTAVCCPMTTHPHGLRLDCSSKSMPSSDWLKMPDIWLEEGSQNLCFGTRPSPLPSHHYKVSSLDLSHNTLQTFPDVSNAVVAGLEQLNLSHNTIRSLPDVSGASIRHLTALDVSFNRLTSVSELSRLSLPHLTFLDLSHNSLQDLPRHGAWRRVERVEELRLSHNHLTRLHAETFSQLTSLTVLLLSHNQITGFPVGVLDEASEIRVLDVSSNGLLSVPRLALPQLKLLNLSHNHLHPIDPGSFRGLPRLESLDLTNNGLHSLPAGSFKGLAKLHRLNLSRNQVKAVSKDTFQGLEALRQLDLSHNQLATVRKAAFVTLKTLLRLDVSHNRLQKLQEHCLAGLSWLEQLDLSHNHLQMDPESLPAELFSPLAQLRCLYLHGNQRGGNGVTCLRALQHLQHLSVDAWSGTEFVGEDFAALTGLRKLSVPTCRLESLTEKTFQAFGESLTDIRLEGCPLRTVEGCVFCAHSKLEHLSVTGRSSQSHDVLPLLKTRGMMIGPQNSALRHLNLSGLHVHPDWIQSVADQTLKNLEWLELLDLSGNNLDRVTLTLTPSVKEILLARNKLQSIPATLTSDLKRLVHLDVSYNNITSLTSAPLVSLDEIAETSNVTLSLHGNQLQCVTDDCSQEEFYRWLCDTRVTLDGGHTPGCHYPCVTEKGERNTVGRALEACERGNNRVMTVTVTVFLGVISLVVMVTRRAVTSLFPTKHRGIEKEGNVEGEEEEEEKGEEDKEAREQQYQEYDQLSDSEDGSWAPLTTDLTWPTLDTIAQRDVYHHTQPKSPVQVQDLPSSQTASTGTPRDDLSIDPTLFSLSISTEEDSHRPTTLSTDFPWRRPGLAHGNPSTLGSGPSLDIVERFNDHHQTHAKEPLPEGDLCSGQQISPGSDISYVAALHKRSSTLPNLSDGVAVGVAGSSRHLPSSRDSSRHLSSSRDSGVGRNDAPPPSYGTAVRGLNNTAAHTRFPPGVGGK